MTVSSLATVHIPSPNRYWGRAYPVTKITPHHMAGNLTVESCGGIFQNPSRQASSNYGIGSDGRIACYVDEDDAAWTSANWDNDNRAITFEIADADTVRWAPSQAAWDSTVALCVDICQRYGIPELIYTGDARGNLTEHMMFSSTSCPGPWWHDRMQQLADEVNAILRGEERDEMAMAPVWVPEEGAPVYRLYDPKGGDHLFTANQGERDACVEAGWKDEGVAWKQPRAEVAIYRLCDHDHFLTASFDEACMLQERGWSYEGVQLFGCRDGAPVYRLFNPNSGDHLFTLDKAERESLVKLGWNYEGEAFRV